MRKSLAPALLISAGFLHIWHGSGHSGPTVFFSFFLLAGAAQIFVAFPVASGSVGWSRAAIALNASLVVIYVVTRVVAPPGEASPEPVDAFGLSVKLLEVSAIFLLVRQALGKERAF